ncbi:hypothetical protein D3C72_889380 [compost metagenome]
MEFQHLRVDELAPNEFDRAGQQVVRNLQTIMSLGVVDVRVDEADVVCAPLPCQDLGRGR